MSAAEEGKEDEGIIEPMREWSLLDDDGTGMSEKKISCKSDKKK